MKLYYHYCPSAFSNCYILGTDIPADEDGQPENQSALLTEAPSPGKSSPKEATSLPREAIIIDPGNMDSKILSLIEDNNYILRAVLITHDHLHHIQGLSTIMKIYNTEIFAIKPVICEHRTTLVKDGDILDIGPFKTEVISIPGHSADSAVYRINSFLFTGDTIGAGLLGSTASSYASATLINALRNRLFSLPGDHTILPGHGPPTSLEAERRFNYDISTFDQQKNSRPSFRTVF